jgi:hypothetical protein
MNNQDDDILQFIETRIKTTMIGSLAKFEQYFGYLWEENSSKRLEYEELWEQARNAILNNGNHQIRLALDELVDFLENNPPKQNRKTFREKYRYKFYFNNGDQ